MRGDHHVVEREQRRRGARLLDEDVDAGAGHPALGERVGQRLLVDQPAAGGVDDPHAGLDGGQLLARRSGPSVSGRPGQVDRDEVALPQQLVQARPGGRRAGPRGPAGCTGRTRSAGCRRPPSAARRARRSGPARPRRRSCPAARRRCTWTASTRPLFSAALALAVCRATASSSAMACSAAETMLEVGALTTITPRAVAAGTSTLSSPTPARATTLSRGAAAIASASMLGGAAHDHRVGLGQRARAGPAGRCRRRGGRRSRGRARRWRPGASSSAISTTGVIDLHPIEGAWRFPDGMQRIRRGACPSHGDSASHCRETPSVTVGISLRSMRRVRPAARPAAWPSICRKVCASASSASYSRSRASVPTGG